MLKLELPTLWPPDAKNWLLRKDPDAGKDWRQEEKGMTEVEMVGCHHWLDGHEFEQALGVGDGQGGLVCCSPWGHKESDMTERLMFYENGSTVKLNNFPKMHKWQHHDLNKGLNRPRVCDTEWNKSEKQWESESYINVCMWNREKWYQWTYLQGRNRDAGICGHGGGLVGVWIDRLGLTYIHYRV